MISVVITTHKGRLEFLKKAIDSVMKQTYQDFEVIIVVDGPDKPQEDYLNSLKSPKVRSIFRKTRFGNDTRPKNDGTRAAKGQYIAYLDGDNQFRRDHLQALHNVLSKDKELAGVYGDRMVYDLQNGNESRMGVYSEFNPYLLSIRNYIDTSDVLVRKDAVLSIGGWDERYAKYVDWNLWLRMAKAGYKFKRVPIIITDFYIHDKQKSQNVHTKQDNEKLGRFIPDWVPQELEIELKPRDLKVAIFSLTYDRLDATQECFGSLNETAGYPFDHYVVDNGSTDGTQEWIAKKYQPYWYQLNKTNQGISKGSNQALDAMDDKYDIIIKVDNDCKFLSQGWLKEVVELYKKHRMVCYSPYVEGLRDSPGGSPRLEYGKLGGQMLGFTKHLGGICQISPASVYGKFRWDEGSALHGVQDLELSQWLTRNGYQMAYIEDLKVEHYLGTQGQEDKYKDYFKRRKLEKTTRA